MSDDLEDITHRFAAYFEAHKHGASSVSVSDVMRIHGGASRETYSLRVAYGLDGSKIEDRLILRRDPKSSLIETERSIEVEALRAFQGASVPVPKIHFLENDPKWLDRAFFVMEEITDCAAGRVFQPDPYGEHRQKVGESFWKILGNIHAPNLGDLELSTEFKAPARNEAWHVVLDHWEAVINEDQLTPQPLVRAAIRWLRRNPPPPAERVTFIHGDYRHGNFLVNEDGDIPAILDWEMCHLGDPLEDVAWALDTIWSVDGDHPGGMIAEDEALVLWTEASGLHADPTALLWWKIFSAVKGSAIWMSSAREFAEGRNMDPVIAFSGWYPAQAHAETLIELMKQARMAESTGGSNETRSQ